MFADIEAFIGRLNGILFSEYTVIALVLTGVLFTLWSGFGQYRALTHGVRVIRGKYDDKSDPGAINHFQALSTALSATVGLGNIAGVAVAVALGGPGAILWMWVIGLVGMALKLTEVTQSMLYRNTDDPDNPHGGPMFVVKKGVAESLEKGKGLSIITGVVFAAVILGLGVLWGGPIAITLCALLGVVLIVMSIRSGAAMGSLIGGIFVVTLIISAITGGNMFQAWNVADVSYTYFRVPQVVPGIIITVLVGAVIIGGIKRIGAVTSRLVPFMCALYLLAGLYVLAVNIGDIPAMLGLIVRSGLPEWLGGSSAAADHAFLGGTFGYAAMWGVKRALFSSESGQGSAPIAHSAAKTDEPVREGLVAGLEPFIDTLVVCTVTALVIMSSGAYNREAEAIYTEPGQIRVVQAVDDTGAAITGSWTIEAPALPPKTDEARRIAQAPDGPGWKAGQDIFMLVDAAEDANTGRNIRRVPGRVIGSGEDGWTVDWGVLQSDITPTLHVRDDGSVDAGVYGDYAGASLTAHAFDRVTPGLGMWLITITVWLFALSTIISWSYYGEQGVVYLFGRTRQEVVNRAVLGYRLIYCLLILFTTVAAMRIFPGASGQTRALIGTDTQLDTWTTLGLGVMLCANIPIMLIFGSRAMKAYHDYGRRLKRGELESGAHAPGPMTDVMDGKDVE